MANHLIIFAHPNPDSFTKAMVDQIVATSHQAGATTLVRDLYAMNFQPVLSLAELKGLIPDEIRQEQQYIRDANLITLVYPVWWMGFPAILKGYLDRVLTFGFAYKTTPEGSKGLIEGKKMQQFINIGNNVGAYYDKGFAQSLDVTLVNGLFNYCGIVDIDHQFFGDLHILDDASRAEFIKQAEQKTLQNLIML